MTAWELIQEIINYAPNPTSEVMVHISTRDEYKGDVLVSEGKDIDGHITSVGAHREDDCLHIEVEE